MKALVVKPKDINELKFVSNLLEKLGVGASIVNQADVEDIGLSSMMRKVDRTKKVSKSSVMKKLSS